MRASLIKRQGTDSQQFLKIRCAFHTEQSITNFCSCKGCLLPLCPSCIKIHVNEHINMRTNPQLQNINDLLQNLYKEFQSNGQKLNNLHKRFVEEETHIEKYRQELKSQIFNAKQNLIASIQQHFKKMQTDTFQKMKQLKYIKNLSKYKDLTKRAILLLKNAERNFFSEESKVMRMIIKYQSNSISEKLQNFNYNSQHFLDLRQEQFLTFSVKDNYSQIAENNIHNLINVVMNEFHTVPQPQDFTQQLKELYERIHEKKQLKKSLYKFLSNKNTPGRQNNTQHESCVQPFSNMNDPLSDFAELISTNNAMSISQARPELSQIHQNQYNLRTLGESKTQENKTYSSVKESIVKATQDLNFTLNRPSKIESESEIMHRRKSISRSKGITLMQSNLGVIDFKKAYNSILRCDVDLTFIKGHSQVIPRRCR